MKNLFLIAIVLTVLFLIPKIVLGSVVINEIAWMGTSVTGVESKDWWRYEWIELYNSDGNPVSIDGWKIELYRTALDYTINITTGTIPANGYFLIVSSDKIPNYDLNYANLGGKFNNSGEKVLLKDSSGATIDNLDFTSGWPAGDNSTKRTMERKSAQNSGNDPTNWQTSKDPGGTPKAANSSGAPQESSQQSPSQQQEQSAPAPNTPPIAEAGDNIIGFVNQEIKLDGSKSSDPENQDLQYSWNTGDGNSSDHQIVMHKYQYPGAYLATLTVFDGRYYSTDTITVKIQNQSIVINEFMPNPSDKNKEWIEIYNSADEIMDISNWQLDDADNKNKAFAFPQNTFIAPKSYIVFTQQVTGIVLDNDKDSVRLLMPEGNVFQEIQYENPPKDKSSARFSNGFIWSEPSPGTTNIVLADVLTNENKTFVYQNPINSQIVQKAENYVINYQNANQQNPQSGYQELAAVRQPSQNSKNNTLSLVLIIIAIVLGASIIGIILIKFRKKFP
jgi:hypothetical protein